MPQFARIDVTKIDKARLFKGKKGTYLDLVIIETPQSEYGTHMIKQSAPKGTEMPILGNIQRPSARKEAPASESRQPQTEDSDVPF